MTATTKLILHAIVVGLVFGVFFGGVIGTRQADTRCLDGVTHARFFQSGE